MNYRQTLILIGLAEDAKDLKIENGWYGDVRQGFSTQEEDEESIQELHKLSEEIRVSDLTSLTKEFYERLGAVGMTDERFSITHDFGIAALKGDKDMMVHWLGELDGTIKMLPDPPAEDDKDDEAAKALLDRVKTILVCSNEASEDNISEADLEKACQAMEVGLGF
jgi:hypothetical protein